MLVKKLHFVILNLLISFFLNLIPFYLSVNYLGRENLGIIGYALSSVTIFSFLYDLGFDMNFMRFLSEDKKEIESKIGTYFYSKLVLIGLTFVISLAFNASWAIIHKWDTFLISTVIIFLIYQVFQGISSSFVYIFNSQGNIVKSQIPQTIGYLIQALITIICIIFDLGIFVIVLGYLFASFSTLIINIILFLGNKIGIFKKKHFNEIRKYIVPLMLVAIFFMIAENLDTILIKINYDALETGIYQFVVRLKPLLFVIANAVMFIYIPIFTSVYNELGKDSVKKVIIFSKNSFI